MTAEPRIALASPGSGRFRARLLAIMDRKDHPSYWRLMGPGATREQLLCHYLQEWAVYVRDFPRMLSTVHARCPEPEVRRELAENLFEEETGGISGGGPHGELFLHMMEGLGFPRRAFDRPRLLPASRAYRRFLDRTVATSPWIVGAAVVTIFVEGSRNDRYEIAASEGGVAGAEVDAAATSGQNAAREWSGSRHASSRGPAREALDRDPLVVNHGLDPRFLELKRVHRKVEGDHRLSAWRTVLTHAPTPAARDRVVAALERALRLWLAYREGVARAAKLG